jgi:hypothetical protein
VTGNSLHLFGEKGKGLPHSMEEIFSQANWAESRHPPGSPATAVGPNVPY